MFNQIGDFLPALRRLHHRIRQQVIDACERSSLADMATIVGEDASDTIYAIDRISEAVLIDFFTQEVAVHTPIILIGEGLPNGQLTLPANADETAVRWRVIIDPIDGTRGLMYQKRPAWILTAVAPNLGPQTSLQHIELALQTEIPLLKQHLSDALWAIRGQGGHAVRYNRLTEEERPLLLHPSRATTIAHGFASISRFFPGGRDLLARIDEALVYAALGPGQPGKAHCFEDQYICSGGQLYELIAGHDRFIADLRPLLATYLAQKGTPVGISCHPYDLCTELIAREYGVIVTDEAGRPLTAPLDTTHPVAWVGYANATIHAQLQPLLQATLAGHGLAPFSPDGRLL